MKPLAEEKENLWRLIVSPTIWAAHFLACYITAAVWCAKFAPRYGTLEPVRWAIGIYTVLALVGIGLNGRGGYRRHRHGAGMAPHDADTSEDRHRFMGFATTLLAVLSAVATVFAALAVVFFEDCR